MQICVDAGATENWHRIRGIGAVASALMRALTPDLTASAGIDLLYLRRRPLDDDLHRWRRRSWPAELSGASLRTPLRLANVWQVFDTAFVLPRDVAATGAPVFLALDPHAVALSKRFVTVAILYDVVPLVFPDVYLTSRRAGLSAKLYRRRLARMARADWWIAISEATKRDAVALAGFDPTRISVAPLGIDPTVYKPMDGASARARVLERLGVQRPYLLFVGARDPRKNLAGLLDAYRTLGPEPPVDLVIVGQTATASDPHVHSIEYADAGDMPALYAGARAFLFPSLYEGFGLPVLEAMSTGTPVVTTALSSIPEVAGDAALYADPRDPVALGQALARIVSDETLRERLRTRGLARAAAFTWRRTAELVLMACLAAQSRGKP